MTLAQSVLPWIASLKSPAKEKDQNIASNDTQEELVLHPKIPNKQKNPSFQPDAASILSSALGGSITNDQKPFKFRESPQAMAALQQRAAWASALKQASQPHLVRDLLKARKNKQKIFLMRHGESQANVSKHDVPDPNLTPLGLVQAKSWQECVGDFGAQIVLVSPLRRTVQTACHAFKYEETPFLLCRFAREIGWGCGENTIHLDANSMRRMLGNLPRGSEVQGIEQALYEAPDDPIDELASLERFKVTLAKRPETVVAVVCHFGVINALTGARAKNGDVYECEWGPNDELKVLARHKAPIDEEGCVCA